MYAGPRLHFSARTTPAPRTLPPSRPAACSPAEPAPNPPRAATACNYLVRSAGCETPLHLYRTISTFPPAEERRIGGGKGGIFGVRVRSEHVMKSVVRATGTLRGTRMLTLRPIPGHPSPRKHQKALVSSTFARIPSLPIMIPSAHHARPSSPEGGAIITGAPSCLVLWGELAMRLCRRGRRHICERGGGMTLLAWQQMVRGNG